MPIEGGLTLLLAAMAPQRRPGDYVFVVAKGPAAVPDVEVLATVTEAEGISIVLHRHDADRAGLDYDFVAGCITSTCSGS